MSVYQPSHKDRTGKKVKAKIAERVASVQDRVNTSWRTTRCGPKSVIFAT